MPRHRFLAATLVLLLSGPLPGCTGDGGSHVPPSGSLPRVPEGTVDAPVVIHVALPGDDPTALRGLAASREMWQDLPHEAFSLIDPVGCTQRPLEPERDAIVRRAIQDLVDPLAGVTVRFGDEPPASPGTDVVALVVVELVPAGVIRAVRDTDAFTEWHYQEVTLHIRRAVVHLPDWLLEEAPDDLANFVAHEFGHALGLADHIDERANHPEGETWFWDRLMTIPIPLGQPWQPVTATDVLAIAADRYTLREGWDAEREMWFRECRPYRPRSSATRELVTQASASARSR